MASEESEISSLAESFNQRSKGVEPIDGYYAGGYHHTYLGDVYQDRYKVIHKLGHGAYSTVWLARDLQGDRNVALKILTSESSSTSSEPQILRVLSSGSQDHPGSPYVCHLLDEFWLDGPSGRHLCLVLRPAGCSVSDSKKDSGRWKFPLGVARSISAQTFAGLDYIHSCGVVHGDLHIGNILLQLPELEHYNEAEILQRFGEPERVPVEKSADDPRFPKYRVSPIMTTISCDDVPANAKIIISDFGQSFLASERHDALQTPEILAPPEHFFGGELSSPVDVWTLAMTTYEILSNCGLWELYWPDPDSVIAEMVNALSRPPKLWWDKWENRSEFFTDDGAPIDADERPLSLRLREMDRDDEIGEDELTSLEELFRGMLKYEPSKRLTASEAAASNWIVRWARPNLLGGAAGNDVE
ncbi:kinase domain-containing protein [Phyllosticta capitalensis]